MARNITGGVGGAKALREGQKGIAFQRWVLRNFALNEFTDRLSTDEMAYVWTGLENQAFKGLVGLGSQFGLLAEVTDAERADAERDASGAETALSRGDFLTGCALLLRARACDPFSDELRERFGEAVAEAKAAATLPDPLGRPRRLPRRGGGGLSARVDDTRLNAYAEVMRSMPDAALAIDATSMDPAGRSRGARRTGRSLWAQRRQHASDRHRRGTASEASGCG